MIDYALNLIMKSGMDGIVSMEKNISKQVKFYNGKIEVLKEWDSKIMNIFMAKKDKKISFSIDDPTEEKIESQIERNKKIMKLMAPMEYHGIQEKYDYRDVKKFDERVIENDKLIEIAESVLQNEVAGIVFSSLEEMEIQNSNGVEQSDRNSMIYLSARIFKNGYSAHDVSCGRGIDDIDGGIVFHSLREMEEARERIKLEEGRYDVIFYPMAFANIISQFASFSSAFYVDAGYSFLAGKIGSRVANENITIYDDGIIASGMASRKFDEEGNATQRTTVIKDGILKSFLHNSTTAFRYNTITTGNAGIMAPLPWNTVVEKGKESMEEMMEGFKGVVITNLWYTRFQNYRNGDFSSVARDMAFYVENGKKYMVRGIRVSDNIERLLKNVEALSRERKQIFWWEVENPVFSPYAMVKDVNLTTPKA